MQSLPHLYRVDAFAEAEGPVSVTSAGLERLATAAPAEFGGPGDLWSPETLLVGALVDCFILTFRSVARASGLEWTELRCEGEGDLDRVDRTTRFTEMRIRATLTIPAGVDASKAEKLLNKAEHGCLITQSLACPVKLEAEVVGA